jgi:hypothetical protein
LLLPSSGQHCDRNVGVLPQHYRALQPRRPRFDSPLGLQSKSLEGLCCTDFLANRRGSLGGGLAHYDISAFNRSRVEKYITIRSMNVYFTTFFAFYMFLHVNFICDTNTVAGAVEI